VDRFLALDSDLGDQARQQNLTLGRGPNKLTLHWVYPPRTQLATRLLKAPAPAASVFEAMVLPIGKPGLRFGDPRVVALFGALSHRKEGASLDQRFV